MTEYLRTASTGRKGEGRGGQGGEGREGGESGLKSRFFDYFYDLVYLSSNTEIRQAKDEVYPTLLKFHIAFRYNDYEGPMLHLAHKLIAIRQAHFQTVAASFDGLKDIQAARLIRIAANPYSFAFTSVRSTLFPNHNILNHMSINPAWTNFQTMPDTLYKSVEEVYGCQNFSNKEEVGDLFLARQEITMDMNMLVEHNAYFTDMWIYSRQNDMGSKGSMISQVHHKYVKMMAMMYHKQFELKAEVHPDKMMV